MMERIEGIGSLIDDDAERISDERRLTPAVLDALRDIGVFRIAARLDRGGLELTPLEMIEVLEAITYHDGSTGWVAMICCDGELYAGMCEDDGVIDELYAEPDLLTSGWMVPVGRAERVDGGFRVTGRWSFGSGILHADRVVGGCMVTEGGAVQTRPDGRPEYEAFFLPTDQITIHDTWFTTGLAGTSSNDYSVDDVFVPAHHRFDFFSDDLSRHPLSAYHGFVFSKLCAVPLGLLRRAIDEFIEFAETKMLLPSFQLAKTEYRVQFVLGAAQADLDAANAYVAKVMTDLWDAVCRGELPSLEERTALARMNVWVSQTAKAAIDRLCEEAGTMASMRGNRLERIRRDATMVTHHVIGQQRMYATAGQMTFGIEGLFQPF